MPGRRSSWTPTSFWSPKQAVRAMRALEREFDIAWCEEPVIRTDLDGLRDVSRAIGAAIATGENLKDVHLFAALLHHGGRRRGPGEPPTWQGLTTCLRAAELAQAFDRPVSLMNSAGRYGAHLAAALPHHTMMEVLEAGRDATFHLRLRDQRRLDRAGRQSRGGHHLRRRGTGAPPGDTSRFAERPTRCRPRPACRRQGAPRRIARPAARMQQVGGYMCLQWCCSF